MKNTFFISIPTFLLLAANLSLGMTPAMNVEEETAIRAMVQTPEWQAKARDFAQKRYIPHDASAPEGVAHLLCFGGFGSIFLGGGGGHCVNLFSNNAPEYSTTHQSEIRSRLEAAGYSNDITGVILVTGGISIGGGAAAWDLACDTPHPWTGNYVGAGMEAGVILGANLLIFVNRDRTCLVGGMSLSANLGAKASYLRIRSYTASDAMIQALNDGTIQNVLYYDYPSQPKQ